MSQSRKEHVLIPGNVAPYAERKSRERISYSLENQTERALKLRAQKYGREDR